MIKMKLKNGFKKSGKGTRLIRGYLDIINGEAILDASDRQGNVVISSVIGCNAYGIIEAGRGPLNAGDVIEGFIVK